MASWKSRNPTAITCESFNKKHSYLFLLIDAGVGGPLLLHQGPGGDKELPDVGVVAGLVVVEHFKLEVPVQVAVAERPDRDHELPPHRVDVVVDVLCAVDDGELASLISLFKGMPGLIFEQVLT